MKRVLIIIAILGGLNFTLHANPMAPHFLSIQELYIKNDTTWSIDLFDESYFNYSLGFKTLDSVEVKSSMGSVIYSLRRTPLDVRDTILQYSEKNNFVVTLTVDSFKNKLHINPKGDYIVFKTYSSSKISNYIDAYDSISFGNFNGAKFPALDSTVSINKTTTCNNAYIYSSICTKPVIGLYNVEGMKDAISGILYDYQNKPLCNKEFYIYAAINYDPLYSCDEFKIVTDNVGQFNGSFFKSDYNRTITSITLFNYFNTLGGIKNIKVDPFQLNNKKDIHLLEDINVSLPEVSLQLSLYPNPASSQATLKYDLATVDNANVEVLDIAGKVIERFPLHSSTGILQLQLGSKYSAGMYVVQVKSGSTLLYSQDLIVNK